MTTDAHFTVVAIWRTEPGEGVIGSVSLEVVGGPKTYLRVWDGLDVVEWGWVVPETAKRVWPLDASDAPRSTGNEPIATTYAVVAATLRNMAEHVEQRDSDEGSIEYLLPEPPEWSRRGEPEPEGWVDDEVVMRATYRIGNRDGQGWVRIFGSINDGAR